MVSKHMLHYSDVCFVLYHMYILYIAVPPLLEFVDAVTDLVNDILIVKWRVITTRI